MGKNPRQKGETEMTAGEFVEYASSIARRMEEAEARGPGDLPNAWERLGRRYGLPESVFYALRYRPPKKIAADVFSRLHNAYQAECARQSRRWAHERELAAAKGTFNEIDKALLGAADWLAGEKIGEE